MLAHSPLRAAIAALIASPAALATTWSVDDSGGADFTTITAAIAAAVDGDVIVVRPGSYAAFDVVDEHLVIRGDGTGDVNVVGRTTVSSLAATREVELANLRFFASAAQTLETFGADANAGVVALRNCSLTGANGGATFATRNGRSAAAFDACTLVIVHASSFTGGAGSSTEPFLGRGAEGARFLGSTALVLDATFRGGHGGEDFDGDEDGEDGGDGASFQSSSVRAAHTTFLGGHGGFGGFSQTFGECHGAGAGGDAVRLESATFDARDVTYVPGLRGQFICGDQPPPSGQAVSGGSATPLLFTPYCVGFEATCPCGNRSLGVAGCETSFATGGGRLEAGGLPSVASDSLEFVANGLPPAGTAILFQGTSTLGASSLGVVFGDGLRCAGGSVTRLASHAVVSGSASFGASVGDAPLSALGAIPPSGGVRFYQAWFRNAASFCTASTFNLTHALEVVWSS